MFDETSRFRRSCMMLSFFDFYRTPPIVARHLSYPKGADECVLGDRSFEATSRQGKRRRDSPPARKNTKGESEAES